eukprot:6207732-Pleurochrysis_carterae.AAC.2
MPAAGRMLALRCPAVGDGDGDCDSDDCLASRDNGSGDGNVGLVGVAHEPTQQLAYDAHARHLQISGWRAAEDAGCETVNYVHGCNESLRSS